MSAGTSNYPTIVAKLRQLGPALRPAMNRGLLRGLQATSSVAQRSYLSGPRPLRLGVLTTRLRNSVAVATRDTGTEIVGRIGSNVVYAPYHEFGFRGAQQVRGHWRVSKVIGKSGLVIGGRVLSRARGEIKDRAGNLLGHKRSLKSALTSAKGVKFAQIQFVRAHSRTVNYRGRPFIRPAFERTEQQIASSVVRELRAAVAQQNR